MQRFEFLYYYDAIMNKQLTELECLNNNIVPLFDLLKKDVNRILASLPPDEAHKMKRKFRKLWRKAADMFHPNGKECKAYSNNSKKPFAFQRKNRKLIALRLMIQQSKLNFNQP